ncbi:Transient receptor potential cation channel subfamily A member 1 [Paramuricea clavata]|uniref:Transient receptor potential cation channel subfamily A member 1 n=1 Tax=Paramuricea clavata TaxID=317549 RepID=A0A7D9D710_PARCT|nr:Transient receptor potential cation channel subfamily A member 1 [Paramuricea clavata]
MKETEHKGCDKFVPTSVTDVEIFLTGLRDSVFQFQLMTIKDDYERVSEGGDHWAREKMRVQVLLERLKIISASLEPYEKDELLQQVSTKVSSLNDTLKKIESELEAKKWDQWTMEVDYDAASELCKTIRHTLETKAQTSDAGPGVSSHEKIVQIRMSEYFMLNCLDLQSRFHYAPGDSSSHIAEKVMRSLNECLGDGRSVKVPTASLLDQHDKLKLTQLNRDELQRLQEEAEAEIAKKCALEIKSRFDGKGCMGTSIHATVPFYESSKKFFFDEEFMLKCANANSATILETCAGKAYFLLVSKFFADHYILYDNGFEGIRDSCVNEDGLACTFHECFENKQILHNGWSGVPVTRIHPPIPDYSWQQEFHYLTPGQIFRGDITEKYGLRKELISETRKKDDFCPRKQLDNLVNSCGSPDLHLDATEEKSIGGDLVKTVKDRNDTLTKMMAKVDDFTSKYAGDDLRYSVVKEIKKRYNSQIKAFVSKKTNASARACEKAKTYEDIDWEKLVRTNELNKLYVSQLDLYLLTNLGLSRKNCDEKGFTKAKKIEEIKKHFYRSTDTKFSSKTACKKPQTSQTSPIINVAFQSHSTSSHSGVILQVPPWGGQVNTPFSGTLTLTNTCPIENFLTIFYALMKNHQTAMQHMLNSPELYAGTLVVIANLFDRSQFMEGKCEWLKLFPGKFNLTQNGSQLNLYGNEEELFVSRLFPVLGTTYKSICNSPHCPVTVKQNYSRAITLSAVHVPPPGFLQESLTQWMKTELQTSTCGLRMNVLPPGAKHYLGSYIVQDPITGQMG